MGLGNILGKASVLSATQQLVFPTGVALYRAHLALNKHTVQVEGREQLDAKNAYHFLELHVQHWRDYADLSAALYTAGIPPPIATFGDNLDRDPYARPILRLFGLPVNRSARRRLYDFYESVNAEQERGRSVWIASTNGLVKKGDIATEPAGLKFWHHASGYKSLAELTLRSPIVPVTQNSSQLYGELLRATRDVTNERRGFDRVMVRTPFTQRGVHTVVRIGEPIRGVKTIEEATQRIDEHMAREYPVFGEDLAAYALAQELKGYTAASTTSLTEPVRAAYHAHREWLTKVRETTGERSEIYAAALQQRVGPLEAKLALIAPGASETKRQHTLFAQADRTLR